MTPSLPLDLLAILRNRFQQNSQRHPTLIWADVESRLQSNPQKLSILQAMEDSGGEPDVVDFDEASQTYLFFDCAAESPIGRRGLCYDREGLESRKENQPANTAIDMANSMGVSILTEEAYRYLQQLGEFDKKTSSWIMTPKAIRKLGGALFCDRRYDHVFVYHNGAQSYYAARGFRTSLAV